MMRTVLLWIGRLAGLAGVLLCVLSLGSRFVETYYLRGISVGTLFNAGVGAMVAGCLAYVSALAESGRH